MSPKEHKERTAMALERLRIPERRVQIPRQKILEELHVHVGGLSQEELEFATELLESQIIDLVPIPELAQMVTRKGRIAHA